MLAVLAIVAFIIAAILELTKTHLDAVIWLIIAGGILVSAHCLWGYYPWRNGPRA
jgi:O-antigen/teichoic acid export membrane protein